MPRLLTRFIAGLRRRGRPTAIALALGFMVLLLWLPEAPLPGMQLALFDGYQKAMPRERKNAAVQIVAIDEASLKRYGQWPWPRDRLAELLDKMAAQQPLAIGLDIFMPETDMTSPEALAERLPDSAAAVKSELKAMPRHDVQLAQAMRRIPVVLGAAGLRTPIPGSTPVLRAWPVETVGGDPLPFLRTYPEALASLPLLQGAASGQGLLAAEPEHGVLRRVPLVAAIGGTVLPSLSIELIRVAVGLPALTVNVSPQGVSSVALGDLQVPTQPGGEVLVHFGRHANDRYASALDIMDGKAPDDLLTNRIAIVALTGLGLVDMQTNARGDLLPGADVHAQLTESLFDERWLQRPPSMRRFEAGALAACGLFLIWLLPRVSLRTGVIAWLTLSALLFGGGAAAFSKGGMLFDAATVWLGMTASSLSLLASLFVHEASERRRSDRALQLARESAAKAAGELSAARRIQMATLPVPATAFPSEQRFTVAALLEPAREVGGDLYDFYMLDERRMLFMIGDVSGKGLPASLFMVVAKALSKSVALGMSASPDMAAILNRANRELARENPEMLFVTCIAGILDAQTGDVTMCNAGHDAPRKVTAGGELVRMQPADGPPLCVLDDFEYPVQRYSLAPGDSLCLTTDGISEAMNEQGDLYGVERLDALLAQTHGLGPEALVAAVREDVRHHVGTAEPSDDLTLLVVRWNGAA
ncbi:SpoIIE family protein phosphatase [Duganella sp. FT92W]|uniref:SpoIIE family protein phosphatase n=1 Tax=Pseudoduganella rivuli TaxID=2666085 RepID=A0A7X2LU55_9BURK|nr:SpoIIE family protein phosphatase [Pseudoduganella rivuli]MRV73608.1 SpoIIE family protein phosphatase [Pseudoduganella rivuli]